MTSYHLSSIRILEESFRQEMIENERKKEMKANDRKKKVEVGKKLETSLQDAHLRFKRNEFHQALVLYDKVSLLLLLFSFVLLLGPNDPVPNDQTLFA